MLKNKLIQTISKQDESQPLGISFVGYDDSGSSLTTYNFSFTIESEFTTFFVVHGKRGSGSAEVSSVTVNGNTAMQAISESASGGANRPNAAIYYYSGAVSGTINVSITFAASQLRVGVGVFKSDAVAELLTTQSSDEEDATFVIGGDYMSTSICASANNGGNTTWTNADEIYDEEIAGNGFQNGSAAIAQINQETTITASSLSSYGTCVMAEFIRG
jgi:hypothetical protein